jgi:thiamine-monophosphate kinase
MSLLAEAIITGQDSQTLASVGEFGLIKALSAWLPARPGTLVGIGDDAAVLAAPDGRVVATTDFLLEGRHFRRDWSGAADVGHKAAARSLADLAAMGAEPSALLVALAAPGELPVSWARELAEGLAAECARAGASVIGGDTARADSVILAVTGLGDLAGRAPVLRSGAVPGDLVAVAGPLGPSAAGLALLTAGLPHDDLVAAHLRPAPPYDAGPEAADLGATAMIDVSDGLLADLGHVAAASGVRIDLALDALRPGEALLTAARAVEAPQVEALRWVLSGGEDHSLAATFPAGTRLPPRWRVIGTVHSAEGRPGHGVVVDGQPWAQAPGWDHFALRSRACLAGDLAGLDAGGADVDPLRRAADRDAAALDVRVPAAAGTAVRERDVVAEDRPLAAYVADGSHSSLHLTSVTPGPCPPLGRIRQPSKPTRRHSCSRTERIVGPPSYAARCDHAQRIADPGAWAQDGQATREHLRLAHGGRSAPALSAPLLHPR